MDNTENATGAGDDGKNGLEWTVFALSLVLVLAILCYLGYQVYVEKEGTPDVFVETRHDPSEHNPYRYHVTVHNLGQETAETVALEVTVLKAGEEVEKAELEIAFVPKESMREGWVNFNQDPALADTVEAHILSYNRP